MSEPAIEPVIRARGVRHVYREGKLVTEVLRGIDFDLAAGERVAIVGQSGSGKSTLLHLLGGLETPSEGQIELCGKNLSALSQFINDNRSEQLPRAEIARIQF